MTLGVLKSASAFDVDGTVWLRSIFTQYGFISRFWGKDDWRGLQSHGDKYINKYLNGTCNIYLYVPT